MKKIALLLFIMLCITPPLWAAPPSMQKAPTPAASQGSVGASAVKTWKLDAKPLDLVHSLDNRYVFILEDDSKVHVYSAQGAVEGEIPVDKGVTAIDIAPRGEMLYLINSSDNTFTTLAVSFTADIDISGSPFLGNENAPVVLVLFSDFQCPYCAKIPPLLDQILEKNPDTVKIVYKNFPLTSIHNMAETAALAGLAAFNQGKFWQMHDALFAMGTMTKEKIEAAAKKIGLDMNKFNADMKSNTTKQRLFKDIRDGREAQVNGTPTLFINGRRVTDRSPQGLQRLIDEELAKTKKGAAN